MRFIFVEKSDIQKADGWKENTAVFSLPADKNCYYFVDNCFQHSKQMLMSCIYNPPALLGNPMEEDKGSRDVLVTMELTMEDITLGQGSFPFFCF